MGAYKYIKASFQQSMAKRTPDFRARLVKWNKAGTIVRLENPTNVVRAHSLGYKATKDFVVARVRISKGKRTRRKADLGRKPGRNRKEVNPGNSLQYFAEFKAKRKFTNLEVVGSYFVGATGTDKYFEIVMRNPHPQVPRLSVPKG